jgi:hypothetical protein
MMKVYSNSGTVEIPQAGKIFLSLSIYVLTMWQNMPTSVFGTYFAMLFIQAMICLIE